MNRLGLPGVFSTFNRKHLIAIVGCLILGYVLVNKYGSPPKAANTESVVRQIRVLERSIEDLARKPTVPSIADSWGRLLRIGDSMGVFVKPVSEAGPDRLFYTGPLKAWNGVIEGDPRSVLTTLHQAQKALPLFLYRYQLSGGKLTVDISVVGG